MWNKFDEFANVEGFNSCSYKLKTLNKSKSCYSNHVLQWFIVVSILYFLYSIHINIFDCMFFQCQKFRVRVFVCCLDEKKSVCFVMSFSLDGDKRISVPSLYVCERVYAVFHPTVHLKKKNMLRGPLDFFLFLFFSIYMWKGLSLWSFVRRL